MHDQSQQHQPNLERLLESFPAVDRRETMDWLVQAFEVVGFPDSMLYASALFLDRYHASRARSEVPARESHRQLLAAVVLALKTDTRDDLRFTLKQVVSHLGRDRVSFRDVVSTELKMLSCLRFTVSTPTALEFLEVLSTRVSHYDQRVVALAEFLLQLTLGDAVVHWGHSHSVLAASTLSMASLTLQVNPDALTSIREDLCVLCPQLEEPAVDLVRCCADLHALWVESTLPDSEIYSFAQHVRTKFGHRRYRSVATIVPPAYAPVLVQEPVPASP
nr:cyclin A1-1 [Crypthecodinium cohnii]